MKSGQRKQLSLGRFRGNVETMALDCSARLFLSFLANTPKEKLPKSFGLSPGGLSVFAKTANACRSKKVTEGMS
jgi:hypothetical protein